MRMKWAQLLSCSFFFFSFFLFFFFFFFLLFIDFHYQKKKLAIISFMMFVESGCVQKMASKIASFFLRLNF